ncbi:hypothetical protein [Caballeronia sp. GAFFF1]|uniref:hypothetical protein n=1 Tax=Caballeronia sp. GAFFF1 TaxID=2921779 RepID=UPI002028EAF6|nr:hypothetical protein [Caballeronia sp. GAFFF1]
MSSIVVRDLSHNKQLDCRAMSAVSGGLSYGPYANVNVNVGILQNISQLQNVQVNTLNDVGVIGANFGAPSINVDPKQFANLKSAVF